MNNIETLIGLNLYHDSAFSNINVDSFQEYIEENFNIYNAGALLIRNIIEYVKTKDLNIDETVDLLMILLDGLGIDKSEIIHGLYNYPL